MKDTKLISNFCKLKATNKHSMVMARRIRSDDCRISTIDGNIVISSYIEASCADLQTRDGDI